MTENIDYRFRGIDAGLDAAAKKGAASLRGLDQAAERANQALTGVVAIKVAETLARTATAAYESATAWRDNVKALGQAHGALSGVVDGVDSAEESLRRMKDSGGAVAAQLLSEFAPTIDFVADRVRDLAVGLSFVIERSSLAFTFLTEGVDAAFAEFQANQGRLEAISASLLQSTDAQIDANGRARKSQEDANKALAEAARIANTVGDAQRRLLDLSDEAGSDQLNDLERLTAAYERQLQTIRDIEDAALAVSDAETYVTSTLQAGLEARTAAQERYYRDVAQLELTRSEEIDRATSERIAKEAEAARALADQRKAADSAVLSSAVDTASTLVGLAKQGSKEQAIASKAASLFGVAVNTAEAITKAGAQLGAFALPAQIALGVLGATQAAVIASQPLPSFDRGGVVEDGPQFPGGKPGQVLVQAEKGEGFFTKRQMQAMGGGGSTTVVLTLGARELKRVVVGSGMLDGVQKRRGFGQRRYGG